MRNPGQIRGIILIAAGLGLLLLSGSLHSNLIEMRKVEHLQQVAPEDTTPLVALTTVAFGGFRGLVADALWVRANKMQEEAQYFEMVQLAKWITQLEPRVPEVWSFQAWNLAYNISVLFPEFEDRWRWVNHGLDLLRKEGLTQNPNSPELFWDIGWMFQHKIGMEFDSAHRLYKQKIKEQVVAILPDGYLYEDQVTPQIAEALEETFAMSVDEMLLLETLYGPLDWRLPATHVLYWSSTGLAFSDQENNNNRRLRRMQMQSLGQLMRSGRMIESEDGSLSIKLPRTELIPLVISEYENMLAASPYNHYLKRGFSNFLNDATLVNADYGDLSNAYFYYQKLAEVDENIQPGEEAFQAYIQYQLTRNPGELNYDEAMTRVVALLIQSLTTDNQVRSRGFKQMAEQFHRLYQDSRTNEEHQARTGLPPFNQIYSLVEAYLES
ncbi:hypothetical protein P3T73_01220 [Kiritimatiellota bacterium B12222]|nr:hypothetical protein P3T73_01220 [Kiritimatiellota bacterium B12222]